MNSWPPPPPPPGLSHPPTTTPYNYPAAAVQVRQGFGQLPPHPPAAPAAMPYLPPSAAATPSSETAPTPGKVTFSDAVRDYVRRAFLPSNLDPTVSRQDVEARLKENISHAADNGYLNTADWDNMPLPTAMIKQERQSQFGTNSKKRKSSDLGDDKPWRSTNDYRSPSSLEDRITYPSPSKHSSTDEPSRKLSKSQKQMEKRQRRWGNVQATTRSPTPPPSTGPVVGTCENLEKKYLRLTAAPVPSQVRPEAVLHMTVDFLKKKWRKEANYSYICDQLKSVRQDLTVQRIKNDFTVGVYELHARIALEKGDLGEYNQCQTQLRMLYGLGLGGDPVEFKAYRILYFIHTANRTGLNDAMADLTTAEKFEGPIKHALSVRSALALGNYHKFFQLYLDTPNMGAYLMDMFVVRERLAALCNICKAYKPDVKLRFITEELGFESDHDAAQFVVDHNGQDLLEERGDYISFITGKAGQRFEASRAAAFRTIDIKGQI